MPTALVLTIQPETSGSAPLQLGRYAHAAILELIRTANPALAEQLHKYDAVKPLTVSNVMGLDRRGSMAPVVPERTYNLRLTMLNAELEALASEWEQTPPPALSISGIIWRVVGATTDPSQHPWAGRESYDGLIAGTLRRAGALPTRWELEFATPVTFRQHGINQPLPIPELVFGSLLDRWNALAPLPLPVEIRGFAAEQLAISCFDLRSTAVPIKAGALQIGALGRCAYTAARRDHTWSAAIDLLAQFAFYSGVGAGTTRGLGQARSLSHSSRGPELHPANDRLNGQGIAPAR